MSAKGVVMHCTGSDSIKVTTQLKTSENSWEHRKTSKIIWYQLRVGVSGLVDRLSQTSPIPRSIDGDNKKHELLKRFIWYYETGTFWRPKLWKLILRPKSLDTDTNTLKIIGIVWIRCVWVGSMGDMAWMVLFSLHLFLMISDQSHCPTLLFPISPICLTGNGKWRSHFDLLKLQRFLLHSGLI